MQNPIIQVRHLAATNVQVAAATDVMYFGRNAKLIGVKCISKTAGGATTDFNVSLNLASTVGDEANATTIDSIVIPENTSIGSVFYANAIADNVLISAGDALYFNVTASAAAAHAVEWVVEFCDMPETDVNLTDGVAV